jgi:hypothetical protein
MAAGFQDEGSSASLVSLRRLLERIQTITIKTMMMPPMIPTTVKTPVSRGLFWRKEGGAMVAELDEEAETVAVTIAGLLSELEVTTEVLPDIGVELVDGVEDVEEFVVDVLELDLR